MDSVSDDFKAVDAVLVVHVTDLSLLADVGFDPEGLQSLLAVVVDELAAKLEAGADVKS